VQFETASRLWVQRGHPLRGDFQALVTRYREDALGLLDFARDAAAAREAIDAWVSERGRGAIGALLGPASLSSATRLAIASTAYLRAPWKIPFAPASTRPGAFTDDAGQRSSVSFMTQDAAVGHASRDGWTAVELLYAGDELSMVFLLPETQPLRTAQQQLDDELLSRLLGALERRPMRLLVPRFRVEWAAPLSPVLRGLGATDAFSERADFSGIDGSRVLQLAEVVHRTALTVDETGTEVTTASAALIRLTSARRPPLEVRLDRPFAFLVRDRSSGAFLFVGRVGRP
jgi:serpin B